MRLHIALGCSLLRLLLHFDCLASFLDLDPVAMVCPRRLNPRRISYRRPRSPWFQPLFSYYTYRTKGPAVGSHPHHPHRPHLASFFRSISNHPNGSNRPLRPVTRSIHLQTYTSATAHSSSRTCPMQTRLIPYLASHFFLPSDLLADPDPAAVVSPSLVALYLF
jgi:hypothetical protein